MGYRFKVEQSRYTVQSYTQTLYGCGVRTVHMKEQAIYSGGSTPLKTQWDPKDKKCLHSNRLGLKPIYSWQLMIVIPIKRSTISVFNLKDYERCTNLKNSICMRTPQYNLICLHLRTILYYCSHHVNKQEDSFSQVIYIVLKISQMLTSTGRPKWVSPHTTVPCACSHHITCNYSHIGCII